MEPNKGQESGEMYSPDNQGEYMPEAGTLSFSIQGLSDALTALDTEVTMVQPPSEKYALLLEITMADHLGCPHPSTFSWSVEMVMHVLKGDPTLKDLEHVQIDGPGMAYLFFFDKQGHKGLVLEATQTLRNRHSPSGSPALHTLLSFSFHWQKAGSGQLLHQNGTTRGLDQSMQVAP